MDVQRTSDVTERKPATAPEYLAPPQRRGDPVTRQTLAFTLIVVPTVFGAFALYRLGTDSTTLYWVTSLVLSCGALGGWLHHPVRRFRRGGAVAGMLAAGGALFATYLYVDWRGGDQKVRFAQELLLPIVIGAAPAIYFYYSRLRDEHVEVWEQPSRHDVGDSRRQDGVPTRITWR